MAIDGLRKSFLLLALLLLLAACGGDASRFEQAVEVAGQGVTGLSVNALRDYSQRGEKLRFTAVAALDGGGQQDFSARVRWRVSDPALASIDASGLLFAAANGVVDVIAEFANFSARKTLTINDAQLESLSIDKGTAGIDLCLPAQLGAIGLYSDGTRREIRDLVDWSSATTGASVVNEGADKGRLVVTEPLLTVSLTVSKGQVSKTDKVLVQANLKAVAVSPASASLKVGDQQQFQALGDYLNRDAPQDISDNVKWSSAAPEVASVDGGGLARAVANGSATILASCGGKSGSAQVTVTGGGSAEILKFFIGDTQGTSATCTSLGSFDLTLQAETDSAVIDATESAEWSIVQQDPGLQVSVSNAAGSKGRVTLSGGKGGFIVQAVYRDRPATFQITVDSSGLTPPPAPGGIGSSSTASCTI